MKQQTACSSILHCSLRNSSCEHFIKLDLNALHRDILEQFAMMKQRSPRSKGRRKVINANETNSSQHAQRILLKASFRVAYRAQRFFLQVIYTVIWIIKLTVF